jgi:uncharacterized surface protein with fasciclin (FAS1) repeats
MKHIGSVIFTLISMLFFSLLIISCKKDDDNSTPLVTIKDEVAARSNLTLMDLSLEQCGLSSTLDSAATFTVFAPTNEAFAASGIDAAKIGSLTDEELIDILLYHAIDTKYMAADLPAGPNAKIITVSGDSIFITNNFSGVYVNGIKVSTANILASNGVLHLISKVLMPPAGNIVVSALADTTFTYLAAAVVRASEGTTNVAGVLAGPGIYTVFAPTNQGFRDAGFATVDDINAADPNTLAAILTYHVLAGRVFSSDLTEGAQPTTLEGGALTISLLNGANVKGTGNSTAANIVGTNIMASNGVIHVIDKVLLKL